MKKKDLEKDNRLSALLNKELLDKPSAEFADKLLRVSMTSYCVSYSRGYRKEEWLGKAILCVLVFFNLMMLYELKPDDVDVIPMVLLIPFLIGIYYLVRMNIRLAQAINHRHRHC